MKRMPERSLAVLLLVVAAGCELTPPGASCGAGTYEADGQCLPLDGGVGCGPGTSASGTQCVVIDAGAGPRCGAGTVLSGSECVPLDLGAGVACGPGTTLLGEQCVANDLGPGVSCGPGTTLEGGQCTANDLGPGIACGPGTELDGGVCVALTGVTCAPGTSLSNGVCVPAGTECPGACNAFHVVPDLGCSPCPCHTPYYDAQCYSQANGIAISAVDYGSLGPGESTYYSFLLPSTAGYGFVTVTEVDSTGSLDVYVRQSFNPFGPPIYFNTSTNQFFSGGPLPDYAYSDTANVAKHLVLVPPPNPPTDYYYVFLRRNGTSLAPSLAYNITVIPY